MCVWKSKSAQVITVQNDRTLFSVVTFPNGRRTFEYVRGYDRAINLAKESSK